MNKGTKSVNVRDYYNNGYKEGFQKGKLEQKKEELTLLEDLLVKYNSRWLRIRIKEEIKQLQKEIGDESK